MKVPVLLAHAAFAFAAVATIPPSAMAQVVVSVGNGRAHDCFIHAKTGNDPRQGVAVCTQAISDDVMSIKDRAGTYDNRGVILDRLGRTDEAKKDFDTAIAMDTTLGDPYVNLGAMLIKKGRHEEALVQINKGLELGLGFAYVGYYDRAIAEQMLGRFKEAYYDYKKVLELEPEFAPAAERLKDFTVTRVPAKPSS